MTNDHNGDRVGQVLGPSWRLHFKLHGLKDPRDSLDDWPLYFSTKAKRGGKSFQMVASMHSMGDNVKLGIEMNIFDENGVKVRGNGDDKGDYEWEMKLINQDTSSRSLTSALERDDNGEESEVFSPDIKVLQNSKNGWTKGGFIIIEAEIRQYVSPHTLFSPPSILRAHMRSLLHDSNSHDMTFAVEGHRFKAHRCIVDQSSHVLAVSETDTDGNTIGVGDTQEDIVLNGIRATVFQEVLEFIYTDEPTDMLVWDDDTLALLEAADRYKVERLKVLAETHMCSADLPVDRVAELLSFAQYHNCPQLKETCLALWASNSTEIMESSTWAFITKDPLLLTELISSLNTKLTGRHAVCAEAVPDAPTTVTSRAGTSAMPSPERRRGSPGRHTLREIRSLSVAELRCRLSERGLSYDGLRPLLEDRLIEAMLEENGEKGDDGSVL